MRKKVYIAGPISSDPIAHTGHGIQVYHAVWDMGGVPYLPHFTVFAGMFRQRTWEEWLDHDREWLLTCDAMFRIPGQSKGADLEEVWAREAQIPVFYSLDRLRSYLSPEPFPKLAEVGLIPRSALQSLRPIASTS